MLELGMWLSGRVLDYHVKALALTLVPEDKIKEKKKKIKERKKMKKKKKKSTKEYA